MQEKKTVHWFIKCHKVTHRPQHSLAYQRQVCLCVCICHKKFMSACSEKKNVTNTIFVSLTPRVRFRLCMIYNQHLTGVFAAAHRSFPGKWSRGMGLPVQQLSARPSPLNSLDSSFTQNHRDTYLRSPGNSVRLRMAPKRGKEAERTGGKGMDRSTVRVVVPFSGCAAPSLHPCSPCRVGERSLAIEGGREQRRGQERRERRRRWEGGPTVSQVLSISRLALGWCKGLWRLTVTLQKNQHMIMWFGLMLTFIIKHHKGLCDSAEFQSELKAAHSWASSVIIG